MSGLHVYRLKPEAGNPREVAFAEQWAWENKHHEILDALLSVPCDRDDPQRDRPASIMADLGCPIKRPFGEVTERDKVIAATLMQWLGSNVGLDFVRQSLRKCGYELVREE